MGSGKKPAGVNEDSSTDVRALEPQAGLPRPLASLHVPATIDPPHHLGLPAHCGDSAATYNRDPMCRNKEGHTTSQMGKPRPGVQWPSQNDRATWTLPSLAATEDWRAEHNTSSPVGMRTQGSGGVGQGGTSSQEHLQAEGHP